MAAVSAAELNELAANLATISTHLKRHIADEGQKVGAALGKTYAKAADERIKDNAAELQRATDLAKELLRQRKVLDRRSDQYAALEKRIAELAGEARRLGEGVPHAVLYAAITNVRNVDHVAKESS